jgi:hypothetical protein
VVKKGKESDKKCVIIMLIFQRKKLPFENMLCLFSARWPGGGMKAKNMLCFFSPLGGREDEGQKQKKLPEMFLIFLIANIPANKSQIIKR